MVTNCRIVPELTHVVRCTAIKHGSNEDWMYMFSVYNRTTRMLDRIGYATALACSQNVSNVRLLLDTLLGNVELNSREVLESFSTLCSNAVAQPVVKKFFFDNLMSFWRSNPSLLLMLYVYDGSASPSDLEELKSRWEQFESLGPAAETLITAIQSVEKNIRWLMQNQQAIMSWLTGFTGLLNRNNITEI